jgi:hypothetical protein
MKALDLTVKFSFLTAGIGAALEGAKQVTVNLLPGIALIVAGVAVGVFALYLIEKQAKE